MRAAIINRFGSADEFQIKETEPPVLKDKMVLVKIHATSVNPVDWKIRNGDFKLFTGKKFPKILGSDFSGEVLESNIDSYQPGDTVFGLAPSMKGGCYAEQILVKEDNLARKPVNVDHLSAAVLPLVGCTAIQALIKKAGIKQGSRILLNGCTGGVGSMAVQIAKIYQAEVHGVCSARNLEYARELGVDTTMNYEEEAVLGRGKFDIIFDTIGNLKFKDARRDLNRGGVFVTTRFSPALMLRSMFSSKCKMLMVKPSSEHLNYLRQMVEQELVKPIIEASFDLSDIARAHKIGELGKTRGKIAIKI